MLAWLVVLVLAKAVVDAPCQLELFAVLAVLLVAIGGLSGDAELRRFVPALGGGAAIGAAALALCAAHADAAAWLTLPLLALVTLRVGLPKPAPGHNARSRVNWERVFYRLCSRSRLG